MLPENVDYYLSILASIMIIKPDRLLQYMQFLFGMSLNSKRAAILLIYWRESIEQNIANF